MCQAGLQALFTPAHAALTFTSLSNTSCHTIYPLPREETMCRSLEWEKYRVLGDPTDPLFGGYIQPKEQHRYTNILSGMWRCF